MLMKNCRIFLRFQLKNNPPVDLLPYQTQTTAKILSTIETGADNAYTNAANNTKSLSMFTT